MEVRVAELSKPGSREVNEDACAHRFDEGMLLCALCDGAGGHGGGDVASRLALDGAMAAFSAAPGWEPSRLEEIVRAAHHVVCEGQRAGGVRHDMRSTIVLLAAHPGARAANWAHVGDSRLYWFRNGWRFVQTRDHSVAQSMADAVSSSSTDLRGAPGRNALLSSLGSHHDLLIDVLDAPIAVENGDAALLCSDGFWEDVPDREMESTLQRSTGPQEWLLLMERTLLDRNRPARDNYSALAVWFGVYDPATAVHP